MSSSYGSHGSIFCGTVKNSVRQHDVAITRTTCNWCRVVLTETCSRHVSCSRVTRCRGPASRSRSRWKAADRFNQRSTACRKPGRFDAVNAGRFAAMRSIRRQVNRIRLGRAPSRHARRRFANAICSKRLDCLYCG